MKPSGAAVFGWPLLWALPMLAYRALGFGLSKHVAWDFGFALSLALRRAHGRRRRVPRPQRHRAPLDRRRSPPRSGPSGRCSSALIAGHHAWANGQWEVDVGLHNYSEPLSTLLVTAGAALVLSPRLTQLRLALAGCALSAATLVKLSNALLAAAALVVVFLRGRARDALAVPRRRARARAARRRLLAALVPEAVRQPAVVAARPVRPGARRLELDALVDLHAAHARDHRAARRRSALAGSLRPWALALVLAFLLINPIFYSFYANTAQHPRFLYASLPELFVLWAAGIGVLVHAVRRGRGSRAASPDEQAHAASSSRPAGAAAGAALRVWAVLLPQGALDADEAVVGLMARGILHGTLPVFFPGQGYGGTQESFLAAPLVAVFGLERWAIRIVVVAALGRLGRPRLAHRPARARRAARRARRDRSSGSGRRTSTGSRRARTASTARSSSSASRSCCSSCASPSA